MNRKEINLNAGAEIKKIQGFTLIEIVIYCAIFIMFAIYAIQSLIWINTQMARQINTMGLREHNVYKIDYSNIYKRYKIENEKIRNQFGELVNLSKAVVPTIKEDRNLGIILNQTQSESGVVEEKYDVIFFDEI